MVRKGAGQILPMKEAVAGNARAFVLGHCGQGLAEGGQAVAWRVARVRQADDALLAQGGKGGVEPVAVGDGGPALLLLAQGGELGIHPGGGFGGIAAFGQHFCQQGLRDGLAAGVAAAQQGDQLGLQIGIHGQGAGRVGQCGGRRRFRGRSGRINGGQLGGGGRFGCFACDGGGFWRGGVLRAVRAGICSGLRGGGGAG